MIVPHPALWIAMFPSRSLACLPACLPGDDDDDADYGDNDVSDVDDDDDDNEHEAKVHPCHVWQLKWRRASQAVVKQGDIDSAAEYFAD